MKYTIIRKLDIERLKRKNENLQDFIENETLKKMSLVELEELKLAVNIQILKTHKKISRML